MARLLIVANGLYGGMLCSLELARRLRGAGHEIIYAAPEHCRAAAQSYALDFVAIPRVPLSGFRSRLPSVGRGLSARTISSRRRRLIKAQHSLGVEGFGAVLDAARPDLVLIDFELHAHIMSTAARGFRLALYTPIVGGLPGLRSPPLHMDIVPGKGLPGSRVGVAVAWLYYWGWKLGQLGSLAAGAWGGDPASILARHAQDVGFDMRGVAVWRWQFPWSYKLPLLILEAREFDLPVVNLRNVAYLGPMIARDRPDDSAHTQSDEALRLLDRTKEPPGSKLIYAAFGTMITPEAKLVRNLVEAARRNANWRLVMVIREEVSTCAPADLPENTAVLTWAPQLKALKAADLAVLHAGASSIVESVLASTPMIVYAKPQNDQLGNAARVEYHGLGKAGRAKDDADKIERDIASVLSSEEIRLSVDNMRKAFCAYEDNRVAEDVVDQLLRGREEQSAG